MSDLQIEYRIIRSSRKTMALQILPDGSVVVRCSHATPEDTIRKFVEEKTPWLRKHLANFHRSTPMESFSPETLHKLGQQAADYIPGRVALYAPMVGVTYRSITIRCQRSRWGSCNRQGDLNFNCLLMLVPKDVLDYVVVHELCHRKQMNHSAAFWAEVEKIVPNWKEHRKWLRENGDTLIGRLP